MNEDFKFSDELLENINLNLFEISDNEDLNPIKFFKSIISILEKNEIPNSYIVVNSNDLNDWNVAFEDNVLIGQKISGEKVFLYMAYDWKNRNEFFSHAEIVDEKDLQNIFGYSGQKCADGVIFDEQYDDFPVKELVTPKPLNDSDD